MNKQTAQYLSHAENRVQNCITNARIWAHRDDDFFAGKARADVYKWIGAAQEQHQEDHF